MFSITGNKQVDFYALTRSIYSSAYWLVGWLLGRLVFRIFLNKDDLAVKKVQNEHASRLVSIPPSSPSPTFGSFSNISQ